MKFEYDVIVVGAGHAGCEAAVAAARMGMQTMLVTMDMGKVAQMSCNPAVGGIAKGQIVREIDALGGQMGLVTDKTTIQFRMLNRSKGAAMWSPRAQCDKDAFSAEWRRVLDTTDGLYLWQDEVTSLLLQDGGTVTGIVTRMGVNFRAKAVILTNGTFLNGLMHVGTVSSEGGRAGDMPSKGLSEQLAEAGFEVDRMKTGTPVRLDGRTVDFSRLEPQYGDRQPEKFSFSPDSRCVSDQLPCYLVYTSPRVHEILREGFDRSPLFTGVIRGVGPRYCPSIEDKLRTFADKDQHQLFLEPEGRRTNEYYLNGFSSSLPWEVQVAALQEIPGMEKVQIYRPGYAIEYDYFPPTQLRHTLETKAIGSLYFAGQINGTTGYEEAAAQGLMAGINAALKIKGLAPLVLNRDVAYIGVLIDDLVTKGVDEPYRMFTSRAEFRILLRQDNADVRLTEIGHEIGLINESRVESFRQKYRRIGSVRDFLKSAMISPGEINTYLESVGETMITEKKKAIDILARTRVSGTGLFNACEAMNDFITQAGIGQEEIQSIETEIKYAGYIEREKLAAEKMSRLENLKIPPDFDFESLLSLSTEARQKLTRVRPATLAHASRIPGVSPADVNVLLVYFGR